MPETKPTREQAPTIKERMRSAESWSRLREITKLIWGDVTRVIEEGNQKLREKFGGGKNEEELTRLADATRLTEKQVTRIGKDAEKDLSKVAETTTTEPQKFIKDQEVIIERNEGPELGWIVIAQDDEQVYVQHNVSGEYDSLSPEKVTAIDHSRPEEVPESAPETESPATAEPSEESPIEPDQPSEEAKELQQAKMEARFGKEGAAELKAEYILNTEKYKEAINEMVESILSPDKKKNQTEAAIVKKMAESFGDYFSETSEQQKEGACWEIFNAIKAQITDEAARREPRNIKRKLAKGALIGAAGFGGSFLLTPVGGILIAGGLRFADTVITNIISKKRLKEYKKELNASDEGKERIGNTVTDLILAKKKTELITEKIGKKETWEEGKQKEFAQRYKENALEYLNTHQAEEIGELTEEQIERKAESLAVYFAMDDSTEKMLQEIESTKDGKENTAWKSLAKVFGKIDNTPTKKFYSGAAALGVGLGIRTAAKTLGMSSKWTRRTMMAFAGYKLGGALGEIAAGKISPESITKKSLESLKKYDFSEATDETILNNYSKELTKARVALSEIPQTTKNKTRIEKWKTELQSREFELLNETIIKKIDDESGTEEFKKLKTAEGFAYGDERAKAKKEISAAGKKAMAYKIAGRAIGVGLGLLTAEASGAIMEKISARMQGGTKAAGGAEIETAEPTEAAGTKGAIETKGAGAQGTKAMPEEYKAITEKNIFAELGEEQPIAKAGSVEEGLGSKRPVPAFKHEIGKAEMPSVDYSYKGGDNIWEESENQLEAVLGRKPTLEEIDAMKDSIVEDMGHTEESGYYNKMSRKQIKEIDWEKYTKETVGTARSQGLVTPKIERPDISTPEPPTMPEKAPPSLAAETEISQDTELPKYTPKEIEARGAPKQARAIEDSLPQPEPKAAPEAVEETLPEETSKVFTHTNEELAPNRLNIEPAENDRSYNVTLTNKAGQSIETKLEVPNEFTKITAMKGPKGEPFMKISNENTKKSVIVKISEVKEKSMLRSAFGGENVFIEGKDGEKIGFKRLAELLGRKTLRKTPVESFDLPPSTHKTATEAWADAKSIAESPIPPESPKPTELPAVTEAPITPRKAEESINILEGETETEILPKIESKIIQSGSDRFGKRFVVIDKGKSTEIFKARNMDLYYDETDQIYDALGNKLEYVKGKGYKWPNSDSYYMKHSDSNALYSRHLPEEIPAESAGSAVENEGIVQQEAKGIKGMKTNELESKLAEINKDLKKNPKDTGLMFRKGIIETTLAKRKLGN